MNALMRYVLLYVRFSADDKGAVSIDRQKFELLEQIQRDGLTVDPAHIFIDEGKSGRNLKRDGIQNVIALIQSGRASHLYAYELSRLSRSVRDTDYLLELCMKHKCEVRLLYGFVDMSSAEGEFATGIQAQLNAYWSRRTSHAMKRYYASASKRGIYAAHKAPLGLERSGAFPNVEWRTNDDFQLVQEVIVLYLSGHGCNSIARILTERGRTWKSGKEKRLRPNPDSIVNLINGIERYQQFLDPLTFARIVTTRAERKDHAANHAIMIHPPALLRGLVVCAVCGTKYTSGHHPKEHGNTHEWVYYHSNVIRCSNPRKQIPRAVLDKQAWVLLERTLKKFITPEDVADAREPPTPPRNVQAEIDALDARLANYMRMLADQRMTESEYDTMRAETLAQREKLLTELQTTKQDVDPEVFRDLLADMYGSLQKSAGLDPQAANELMRLVFKALPVLGTELQNPVLHPALAHS